MSYGSIRICVLWVTVLSEFVFCELQFYQNLCFVNYSSIRICVLWITVLSEFVFCELRFYQNLCFVSYSSIWICVLWVTVLSEFVFCELQFYHNLCFVSYGSIRICFVSYNSIGICVLWVTFLSEFVFCELHFYQNLCFVSYSSIRIFVFFELQFYQNFCVFWVTVLYAYVLSLILFSDLTCKFKHIFYILFIYKGTRLANIFLFMYLNWGFHVPFVISFPNRQPFTSATSCFLVCKQWTDTLLGRIIVTIFYKVIYYMWRVSFVWSVSYCPNVGTLSVSSVWVNCDTVTTEKPGLMSPAYKLYHNHENPSEHSKLTL